MVEEYVQTYPITRSNATPQSACNAPWHLNWTSLSWPIASPEPRHDSDRRSPHGARDLRITTDAAPRPSPGSCSKADSKRTSSRQPRSGATHSHPDGDEATRQISQGRQAQEHSGREQFSNVELDCGRMIRRHHPGSRAGVKASTGCPEHVRGPTARQASSPVQSTSGIRTCSLVEGRPRCRLASWQRASGSFASDPPPRRRPRRPIARSSGWTPHLKVATLALHRLRGELVRMGLSHVQAWSLGDTSQG
jgi:hypothetical protein